MAISERERNDLYTGLSNAIGESNTETLMKAFPLHGLDEVATKGDMLAVKGDVLNLKSSIDKLEKKVDRLMIVLIAGLFGVIATLIGVTATNFYFN